MDHNEEYIIIALVCLSISVWLFVKLKNERKQREKLSKDYTRLVADNALLEAEQLKFQLQPHTLNNILADLKLIASKLNKGMDSLSETLEYILYRGKGHFVSVKDEIDFINKYIVLKDIFSSEIDSIRMNTSKIDMNSPHYLNPCIPHLITAYFIENAFKHGDANHKEFLTISVSLIGNVFEINVVNKIKKATTIGNGGLGLTNMKKRLDLLVSNQYEIKNNMNEEEYHASLIIKIK
jgi:LytS/YehU family sensor histidine kinase